MLASAVRTMAGSSGGYAGADSSEALDMNLLTLLTGIDAQVCLDVLGAARDLPVFGTAVGSPSQEEESADTCSYAHELRRHASSSGSDLPEESEIQTILGAAAWLSSGSGGDPARPNLFEIRCY